MLASVVACAIGFEVEGESGGRRGSSLALIVSSLVFFEGTSDPRSRYNVLAGYAVRSAGQPAQVVRPADEAVAIMC